MTSTRSIRLLRHAKTEAGSATQQDHERALTERGREQAHALGRWLSSQLPPADVVLCSTATRTRETMAQLAASAEYKVQYDDGLYLATAGDVLAAVQHAPDTAQTLMVVGHNPGLHYLAMMLAGTGDARLIAELEMGFPTSALAWFESSASSWRDVSPDNTWLCGFRIKPEPLA